MECSFQGLQCEETRHEVDTLIFGARKPSVEMRAPSRYLQQLLRRKVGPVVGPVLRVAEVLSSDHVELVEHHM